MPITLLDLFQNSLVLHQTAPYLGVTAIYSLARTSKAFNALVGRSLESTRYLDLSRLKAAQIGNVVPLDRGGNTWRAERMDESLTEDDFYSGPLRGIFAKLERKNILGHVSTLILDGLTVPTDLVRDILCEPRFNVRILSIRECKQLNESKLMQLLRYLVRPSRADDTPKLKGLYVFGPRDAEAPSGGSSFPARRTSSPRTPPALGGVTTSRGAQIGAAWNERSSQALTAALTRTTDKWYQPSGRLIKKRLNSEWAETVLACEGIIAFDAVVCRGPRHDPHIARDGLLGRRTHTDNRGNVSPLYLPPAIARVALGPSGCATCESAIEGPAIWGESPASWFPLLAPPPLHSSTARAAKRPHTTDGKPPPRFFARCEDCLKDRWCERCGIWWDEPCYRGEPPETLPPTLDVVVSEVALHSISTTTMDDPPKEMIKTMGSWVECYGCGRTCGDCVKAYIRKCVKCKGDYCIEDDEGSSATMCDWCISSGRRTRVG